MLSTISGSYFAGHYLTVPVVINNDPKPLPTNLVVYYDIANSSSFTGSSIVSLTTTTNTATGGVSQNDVDYAVPKNLMSGASFTLSGSSTAYISSNTTSTVSFWFYFESNPTSQLTLLSIYDSNVTTKKVVLYLTSSGTVTLIASNETGENTMTTPSALAPNQWHMFTFIYGTAAGTAAALFVDGVNVTNFTVPATSTVGTVQTTLLTFGLRGTLWSKYMMWNAPLTSAQILGMYNAQKDYFNPPTLAVFYDISNAASYSAASQTYIGDVSTYGSTLGISSFVTSNYIATAPKAMGLGTTSRAIGASQQIRPFGKNPITISFWIKVGSLPQPGRFLFYMRTSSYSYTLSASSYPNGSPYAGASGVIGFAGTGITTGQGLSGNGALVAGVWRMITLVYAYTGTASVYVNGSLSSTFNVAGSAWEKSSYTLELSMLEGGGYTATGTIWSQFRIERKGYSASDVATLFANTRGYFGV